MHVKQKAENTGQVFNKMLQSKEELKAPHFRGRRELDLFKDKKKMRQKLQSV